MGHDQLRGAITGLSSQWCHHLYITWQQTLIHIKINWMLIIYKVFEKLILFKMLLMRYVLFLISWFITGCVKVPLHAEVQIIPKNHIHAGVCGDSCPPGPASWGRAESMLFLDIIFLGQSHQGSPGRHRPWRSCAQTELKLAADSSPASGVLTFYFLRGHIAASKVWSILQMEIYFQWINIKLKYQKDW